MESINNTTTSDDYTLYNSPIPTLWADSMYNIDVTANTNWSRNDYGAWIDFDGNREFEVDERILWSIGPGTANVNNTFTVPWDAIDQDTVTMRVRLSHWGTEPRPCGTQYGEVEDYKIGLRNNGKPIGIENVANEIQVDLYPNPTSDKIHINFPTNKKHTYSLSTQIGQKIFKGFFEHKNNILDLSELATGVYYFTN